MSKKVSVIIPVYNAEKYITQCIESLLGQTLQECEFIFVNDGSKDNGCQIIESYKKKDDRIKLVNQKNQGVSIARNTGLHVAIGEYVGFVDADDYIEKDMYEILYNSAKQSNCDVVISNFKSEMEGDKVITKYSFPVDIVLKKDYIEKELLPYFLKADNLNTAVNKIYRNNLIKENNVQFPEKVELGEDGMFNIEFFSNATNMKYIDYTGYYYREVAGSATRNISEKDYFKRAVEVYTMEPSKIYTDKIDDVRMSQLKSIKFINSVMSYIHIYFTPCKDVSFNKRYKYVKNMIRNKYVREALPIYYSEIYSTLGRYEKFVIDLIKRRLTIGLYCVTAYSRFRNK
ncbi:glycosyl transferase family 2 [Bacillus pseudomycoides]|uniref:Glycosyl transferase family 2 n=1 Tax=Bacillus pseudomycoides TaxID=64104 RepID=A0AA91VB03_9BACI|nr:MULTISPECIES: glycosyltransferase [Bacillus]PEB56274.1 glycosyl transferase family 2 [Bacillus sp. AFS098217]PED81704.1 glycosyl transferase family 2 [Bacillus pseudomycoides]PEU09353.1 glycosyl transferase family 2 [Bacillus sp. AFS014408]PEU10632.1 glycosyl transferase family 2 [Bacillus sp. AFS019443]PFW64247.1 glycosyl transferase family 2 [Bacillus sp. AFS075034]